MITEIYNIVRAELEGKKVFLMEKVGEKFIYTYTIASSLEQCESKYRGWKAHESTFSSYINWVYDEVKKDLKLENLL